MKEGEILRINRYKERTEKVMGEVPFATERRENPQMDAGSERVIQKGEASKVEEVVRISTVNGEETARIVLSSRVIKEGKNEIVEVGTKPVENMIHGKKYKKKITMNGTAYDPSAGKWTASGTRARVGAVAVDPRVIPLGTKLYIESNRIDLFYNSRREAYNFGRRNVIVYVLED